MIFVLATGPSMSQSVADSVSSFPTIAVSDAYKLAPWAFGICSTDAAWWEANPEAMDSKAEKFTAPQGFQRVPGRTYLDMPSGTNSGLLGIAAAVRMKPDLVVLLGFDMKGSHYFGRHKPPLKNTDDNGFDVFRRQFARFDTQGVKVINATPGSALKCFPQDTLENILAQNTVGA